MDTTYEFRSRSVGTKVTEEQFARYTQAAGATSLSEWVRAVLDAHLARAPFEQTLMEELWALRFIVLNGLPEIVSAAERPRVAGIILQLKNEADVRKAAKARVLLGETR